MTKDEARALIADLTDAQKIILYELLSDQLRSLEHAALDQATN